jgi:hypothetical protein
MNIHEALEALPTTPQTATITLPDGTQPLQGEPVSAPAEQTMGVDFIALYGDLPVIGVTRMDGSDYTIEWPVEDITHDGPITTVKGPRGILELRRRA